MSARTIELQHPDRFFIGGAWVAPSSDRVFRVVDCTTEEEVEVTTLPCRVIRAGEGEHHGPILTGADSGCRVHRQAVDGVKELRPVFKRSFDRLVVSQKPGASYYHAD